MAKATDTTKGILGPMLSALGFGVGETVKQTVDVTADGAKLGVDVAAGTVDDAVTLKKALVSREFNLTELMIQVRAPRLR